jgi:uncharacterized membrane protein YfcA
MPVFAIFFLVSVAVACTAVVHLANNLFRVGIVGRRADWRIVLLFGLPAIAFALLGAFLLVRISDVAALASYHIGSAEFTITTVKLVVAGLIIFFAVFELVPALGKIEFPRKYIPLGGALSRVLRRAFGAPGCAAFCDPVQSRTGDGCIHRHGLYLCLYGGCVQAGSLWRLLLR